MIKSASKFIAVFMIMMIFCGCETIIDENTDIDNRNYRADSGDIDKDKDIKPKELFEDYYEKAQGKLISMSLEEKVGQMFLARCPSNFDSAEKEIEKLSPGGYILFADNIKTETKASLIDKIKYAQKHSKIPLLVAVDEEGGTVTRVSSYPAFRNEKFDSPLNIYKKSGLEGVLKDSNEKSTLLKSLGINMNLAPVVDVPTKTKSFMYARSFGTDAKKTAEFAKEIVTTMNNDKIVSSLKHFPGYGDNVDTHTGIATDKRTKKEFESGDFLPFIAGIEAKAPTIMVNHNIVNAFDKDNPASLSEEVHRVLREELNFTGLIITDDLAMKAVKKYVSDGNASKRAVLAGNDIIITSSLEAHVKEVVEAVKKGEIDEEIINTAVRRIIACKYEYGIME